jgi:tRNA threonylcarbamoyladenosine biosynthesis protein TsaE
MTLSGQLGAGKTTLTRGILQALGHSGIVKSPTFTVVESYHTSGHAIYHFDLYRINDIEELELIGIRDYFHENALILLEWPEHAEEILPVADIDCSIVIQGTARVFTFSANTNLGLILLHNLKANDTQKT